MQNSHKCLQNIDASQYPASREPFPAAGTKFSWLAQVQQGEDESEVIAIETVVDFGASLLKATKGGRHRPLRLSPHAHSRHRVHTSSCTLSLSRGRVLHSSARVQFTHFGDARRRPLRFVPCGRGFCVSLLPSLSSGWRRSPHTMLALDDDHARETEKDHSRSPCIGASILSVLRQKGSTHDAVSTQAEVNADIASTPSKHYSRRTRKNLCFDRDPLLE